jgi:hypothetical protein
MTNKKEFIQELRKFLGTQGMVGVEPLTPWKPDYVVLFFTTPEGTKQFLKIKKAKKRVRASKKV